MNTPEWNNKTRERDNQKNKWTESSREQWKMESETASKDPILRRRTYQLREATSVSNSNRLFPMPHLGPENAKFRYCYFATTLSRHFPLPSLFRLTFCIFFSFLVFNISSFRMWTLFFCFLGRWVMSYFQLSMLSVLIPLSPYLFFSVSLFHIPNYFIYKFMLLLLFQLYLHPSNNNSTSVSNVQSYNVTLLSVTFSPQWIKTPK